MCAAPCWEAGITESLFTSLIFTLNIPVLTTTGEGIGQLVLGSWELGSNDTKTEGIRIRLMAVQDMFIVSMIHGKRDL